MNNESDEQKLDAEQELEFDEQELETVEISDKDIEEDDKKSRHARRQAKKEAKKNRSPEEKKRARRKKDFLALGILVSILAIVLAVPATRWPILNAVGFRGTLMIQVNEQDSAKPIIGASVMLEDDEMVRTNDDGWATFSATKLGKRVITVSKSGYGKETQAVVNKLGTTRPQAISLKVIGIKLDVVVLHWLSGNPLAGATVSYEKASATTDKTGLASIVIPPTDERKVVLDVAAPGFHTKKVDTDISVASREVSLVAAQMDYFISKRDGKFDIFTSRLDGNDQRKIIEATGKENEGLLQFSINRNNQYGILVANRDGKILNNRIVAGVYIVDLEKSTLRKIDEGSDVQLLDWVDDTIVYSKTIPELNYDDPNLSRIQSYNVTKSKASEIAQSNYFPINLVAQNKVFYMPADSYRVIEGAALTSYEVNSGARRTYLADKRLQYGTRARYDALELQDSDGKNYELIVASGVVKGIDRQPSNQLSFAQKPAGGQVLWTDRRDGQGALLIRSTAANDERIITKLGGLMHPVRFVGDSLAVVRVVTSQETADYVVDIGSGKLSKIVDVSNVSSLRMGAL
ncbi:MAG TPA: hypothetical protein PJ984_00825 [Candidatus Saccharibacteria bacterium]|jgi:hypothetical protein|nr:hypothetical protein [Patescibacteria group bacterium]HMS30923.1 hypothetical protein [Candidatus Saccharibacteria bacterium]